MTVNPTKPDHSRENRDLNFTLVESKTGAGVVAGMFLVVIVLNALLGTTVMNRAIGIAGFALGLWLIGFRPMFRAKPRFRLLDFVLGLLVLASALRALGRWSR